MDLLTKAMAAMVLVAFVVACAQENEKQPSRAQTASSNFEAEAFAMCRKAIALVGKNPSSARVPPVKNRGYEDAYRFEWERGDGLAFQNGFGAMIDATGKCTVNGRTKQVVALFVNERSFLPGR